MQFGITFSASILLSSTVLIWGLDLVSLDLFANSPCGRGRLSPTNLISRRPHIMDTTRDMAAFILPLVLPVPLLRSRHYTLSTFDCILMRFVTGSTNCRVGQVPLGSEARARAQTSRGEQVKRSHIVSHWMGKIRHTRRGRTANGSAWSMGIMEGTEEALGRR